MSNEIKRFRAEDGIHVVKEERDDEYITKLEDGNRLFAWPKDLAKREDIEVLDNE